MTFIITLISLVIERFFDWTPVRRWRWFSRYQAWVGVRLATWPSYLVLVLSLVLPLFIVALINILLKGLLFGFFKLVFGALVVMYCLGPRNFWAQTYAAMMELHRDDAKSVGEKVQSVFGVTLSEEPQAFHYAFTNILLIEANRRVFAVLFWFVLLGPVGAFLYRCVDLCRTHGVSVIAPATKLMLWLDWLPVRFYTFFFALAGHFTKVIRVWKKDVFTPPIANDTLIADCGIAALDVLEDKKIPEDGSAEQEALSLLDRVFVIALVFLAIVVLL
jgi:membrane protein required for beta-lactamase induction